MNQVQSLFELAYLTCIKHKLAPLHHSQASEDSADSVIRFEKARAREGRSCENEREQIKQESVSVLARVHFTSRSGMAMVTGAQSFSSVFTLMCMCMNMDLQALYAVGRSIKEVFERPAPRAIQTLEV